MAGVDNLNSKNIQAIASGLGTDRLLSNAITSFNFDGQLASNIEYTEVQNFLVGSIIFLQSPLTSSNPVSYKISKISKDITTSLYSVSYLSESNLYEEFIERSPLIGISATITAGVATVTVPSTAGMFVGVSLEKVSGVGEFSTNYPVIQSINSSTQITLTTNHITSGSVVFNVIEERGKYIGTEKFHMLYETTNAGALGTQGWALTGGGQSVFSDIYARGRIEALSGSISGTLDVGTNDQDNAYMKLGSNIFYGEAFDGISKQHNGIFINDNNYLLTYPESNNKTITSVVVTNPSDSIAKKTITLNVSSHDFVLSTVSEIDPTEYFNLSGLTGTLAALNGVQRVLSLTATSVTFEIYSTTSFNATYTGLSGSIQKFGNYDPYLFSSLSVSSSTDTSSYNLVQFNITANTLTSGEPVNISGFTGVLLALNSSYQIHAATSSYIQVKDYGNLITPATYAQAGIVSLLTNETKFKIGSSTNFMRYDSDTDVLSVTGAITATSGKIGGFDLISGDLKTADSNFIIHSPATSQLTKTGVSTTLGSAVITIPSGTTGIDVGSLAIIFGVDVFDAGAYIVSKGSTTITLNKAAKLTLTNRTVYIYSEVIEVNDITGGQYTGTSFAVWTNGSVMLNDIVERVGGFGINVTGSTTVFGGITMNNTSADGGMTLRNWTGSSGYVSLATANMTGTEYIALSNGTSTFISSGTGGSVTIRPSANSVSAELEILTSGIFATGNAFFTPVTNSTSNFVFNTSSGTDILRLNGTSNILAMGGSTRGTYTVEVLGSVGYTGSLVDTSSKLVKKNIEVYEVSENILNIPAVTFQYDETKTEVGDQELNKTMIGLIAEDFIDQGMPEVVEYDLDGVTVRGLDYSKITALLIPVIKRQKERIDSLENRLAALES